MKTSDFDYFLPEELIAQVPVYPRDSSRLMVYERETGGITHDVFHNLTGYLKKGDVLVVNNTRVIPARLLGKTPNGGAVEFLLLKRMAIDTWEVLVKPGKKARINSVVKFSEKLSATVTGYGEEGCRIVRFDYKGVFEDILAETGLMPLPHYIKEELKDKERYQTVYSLINGSAAAPTAGLHFTPALLESIRAMGVEIANVLLHVGLGTFRPVKAEDISDHKMHSEYYEVSEKAAQIINRAKGENRRIIAVGTTSVRVLESASDCNGTLKGCKGETDIFIYPGYKFKCVNALITNFHLPKSTLIMLVSAFAGREQTLKLYETAVKEKYRFFSFGDSMFIK